MEPPHDSLFQYDDALLSSCASSALAIIHVRGRGDEPSKLLVADEGEGAHSIEANSDCQTLYEQYAAHYHRPPLSSDEIKFWESWVDHDKLVSTNAIDNTFNFDDLSPRIEAFLRSVIFVHEHNQFGEHTVALNRFSDRLLHELPLMPPSAADVPSFDLSSVASGDLEQFATASALDTLTSKQHHGPMFVSLHDDASIWKFGKKLQLQSSTDTLTDDDDDDHEMSILRKFRSRLNFWWRNREGQQSENQITQEEPADYPLLQSQSRDLSSDQLSSSFKPFSLDKKNKLDGLEDDDDDDDYDVNDTWGRYLNWATENNPDGVPIVHPAMDQGLCGSCWAISATGTLEASIARSMAYTAYEEVFKKVAGGKGNTDSQRMAAVQAAQQIERQAISTADLSVQEIIDCDTRYDQGCAGGNPLFAFYFLHRYGVTSTKNYPYTGTMNKCRYRRRNQPIATVETWGILTADHENNMKKVLRYVGPVAVGLIGADPAFLAYKSGVFFSGKGGKCEKGLADHAMLITGYGEEVSKDGDVVKFWIARNSWGKGWGEDGYVRMARIGGKKGHPGVCGIARSPSVALGGSFKKGVKLNKDGELGSPWTKWHSGNGSTRDGKFPTESKMARTVAQIQSAIHRMKLRQFFAQNDITMVTLNGAEDNDFTVATPLAIILGMISVCMLLIRMHQNRRRRCRSTDDVQNQQSRMEESDIIVSTYRESMRRTGERTHLLENGHCTSYT